MELSEMVAQRAAENKAQNTSKPKKVGGKGKGGGKGNRAARRPAPYGGVKRGGGMGMGRANVGGGAGTSVYVGNLSWDVSWQDLKDHMKNAGNVVHADVMMGNDGRSRGCGLVTFASAQDAENAIAILNDTDLNGRPIFVREDREA